MVVTKGDGVRQADLGTVILEGYLRKKGNHLYSYRFKKKYFYLEERQLKYGDLKEEPNASVDLSTG